MSTKSSVGPKAAYAGDDTQAKSVAGEATPGARSSKKLVEDTGGGCSVCGNLPVVNVSGTYWLCGPCVAERITHETSAHRRPGWRCPECREFVEDYNLWVHRSWHECQRRDAVKASGGI